MTPDGSQPVPSTPTIEWRLFADFSTPLLYEVLCFRQSIFVVEQASPYPDLDQLDWSAEHLLLRIDGTLAGYLRLFPKDGAVFIGRVAVACEWRRRGLARSMMDAAMVRCRRDYPGCAIRLSAQSYLAPFYRTLGFRQSSAAYDDYGVPHLDMVAEPEEGPWPQAQKGLR